MEIWRYGWVLWALLFWTAAGSAANDDDGAGAGARLRAFTGAPSRLVWVRQVDGDGDDPFCWGERLVIMGLDTEDGRGERPVVGEVGNYHRPMLSPDGRHVVFSRLRTREAFAADWEGGRPRRLGEGYAAAVWRDPDSGVTWVYLADNGREGWDRHHAGALDRVRLDDPSVRERVWDGATFTIDNLQLSADGTRFCAQFPHPRAGFATPATGAWTLLGRGCWTSMAPDNSYRVWIFDGPHRNLAIHDPVRDTSWRVPINTAPGMDGYEIYHPRWSNHPRFFNISGPYKSGRRGGNLIAAGGPEVNIWVGMFTEDLSDVERWLQVTDDQFGNFYPDLWIAPAGAAAAPDAPDGDGREAVDPAEDWTMRWEHANANNEAGGRRYDARPTGRAFWGPFWEMETDGGSFRVAPDGDPPAVPGTREFTLEMVLRPRRSRVETAATAVAGTDASGWSWRVEQVGRRFVFRLEDNGSDPAGHTMDLGAARRGRPAHLMLVHRDGEFRAWRDGAPVDRLAAPAGLTASAPAELVIGPGGPGDESTAWRGRVEDIGFRARALDDAQRTARHATVRARWDARTDPPELQVIARLHEALPPPTPESILPYRRALLAQVFTLETVPDGSPLSAGDEIAVAHWAVLDGQVQSRDLQDGGRHRLRITPFDSRPPLESERLLLDADFMHLPFFYEINSTPLP